MATLVGKFQPILNKYKVEDVINCIYSVLLSGRTSSNIFDEAYQELIKLVSSYDELLKHRDETHLNLGERCQKRLGQELASKGAT